MMIASVPIRLLPLLNYIHTYSTATLDSITFGIQGKQAGLNIIINNSINSFTGFSNDTRFAIG